MIKVRSRASHTYIRQGAFARLIKAFNMARFRTANILNIMRRTHAPVKNVLPWRANRTTHHMSKMECFFPQLRRRHACSHRLSKRQRPKRKFTARIIHCTKDTALSFVSPINANKHITIISFTGDRLRFKRKSTKPLRPTSARMSSGTGSSLHGRDLQPATLSGTAAPTHSRTSHSQLQSQTSHATC